MNDAMLDPLESSFLTIWIISSFSLESARFSQADFGKAFFVINAAPGHSKLMFSWKQPEAQLRQIINTAVRFIKARRREEASITFGAFLIWVGIYFPEWLEKAGVKEFAGSWKGDVIGRSILIAAGAGLFLYGAFKIFRLVYVPDLPPPADRPSAIKGPMAFTEDDGALFRKLGRENEVSDLEPLAKLSNLTQLTLDLRSSQVRDLEPLTKLSDMTLLTLDLSGSLVSDMEPLTKLGNLTQLTLDLSDSKVSSLEPLAELGKLTQLTLDLRSSQVQDLEPLTELGNLTQLALAVGHNQGRDWERPARLGNLTLMKFLC